MYIPLMVEIISIYTNDTNGLLFLKNVFLCLNIEIKIGVSPDSERECFYKMFLNIAHSWLPLILKIFFH